MFPDLRVFNNPSSFLAALEAAVNKAMSDVEATSAARTTSALSSSSSSSSSSTFSSIADGLYRVKSSETTRLAKFLITQLNDLGWDKVLDINDTFQKIKLEVIDAGNRKHNFEIEFSSAYIRKHQSTSAKYDYERGRPTSANDGIIVHVDLPYPISLAQSSSVRLSDIYTRVEEEFNVYQQYIQELLDLDANTFILEPTVPSFSQKYRRIAIDKTSSLMIEIDPKDPRKMGSMQFLGPSDAVLKYRISVGQNSNQW